MKKILSEALKVKGVYLGYFTIELNYTTKPNPGNKPRTYDKLVFTKAPDATRKDFIAMGDICYGMYVDDKILKVGKAGGKLGWAQRINTYGKDPDLGEDTNRKIIKYMLEYHTADTKIHVYGKPIEPVIDEYYDEVSSQIRIVKCPRNDHIEKEWIATVESEEGPLVWCNQKR